MEWDLLVNKEMCFETLVVFVFVFELDDIVFNEKGGFGLVRGVFVCELDVFVIDFEFVLVLLMLFVLRGVLVFCFFCCGTITSGE